MQLTKQAGPAGLQLLQISESGLHMTFGITEDAFIRLLHFSCVPFDPKRDENFKGDAWAFLKEGYQFAQVQLAGVNRPYEKQGNMFIATMPGCSMKYVSHTVLENELVIVQEDVEAGLAVESRFRFFPGLSLVRIVNTARNTGSGEVVLEYLGSFSYLGIEKEGDGSTDTKMRLHVPYSGWQKEVSWQTHSLCDLGMGQNQPAVMRRTSRCIAFSNTGNWSSKDFIPMGILENLEAGTLFFQIEHNGSWEWEIGMQANHFFLNLSGPEEVHSHFMKRLKPGEAFTAVPVCVGVSGGGVSGAVQQLTRYRRKIRRPNQDNENLPVIFNDYMNCLFGDPRTDNELPLIQAAADCGCEYYVIDAGWYAPGEWWDGVGEWKECRERFPGGIRELTDHIRSLGMIPGLWLELEVMGIHCPLAANLPDDWFFTRHGRRVYDRSRLQLDFRNPEVRAYADSVIDRLVQEYGAGYIKMDYNIEPGIGTDRDADSPGEGMLNHERAYLAWLDGVFARYPDLVIENCSSGGMRMDYAMLSRYSIQSTSDQEDYISYSTIACNAPSAVTSEQAAVWSYPMRDADDETTAFNMVNAMMGRIHQSGHLAELQPRARQLVEEGIAVYKTMRVNIRKSVPYWPLGFAHSTDPNAALMLLFDTGAYLAVWSRKEAGRTLTLDLAPALEKEVAEVVPVYPAAVPETRFSWDADSRRLTVEFPQAVSARIFALRYAM